MGKVLLDMKIHFIHGSPGALVAWVLWGACILLKTNCSAQPLTAADYSTNSMYASDWTAGQNGGFGFTPWSFDGTSSSTNQQRIDNSSPFNRLGPAWTLFNPLSSDLAEAGRGFAGLQVGQTISTVFENPTNRVFFHGYTVRLVSGTNNVYSGSTNASVERFALYMFDYYPYDPDVGLWKVGSGTGNSYTTLYDTNTASAGARLDFTLTGPNNYQFTLTPLDNPGIAYTGTGALKNSGPIDWIQFEVYNATSDPTNAATDFFVSSITITGVQPIPPKIVVQPVSRVLYPGRTARFNAAVIGTPLSYQWRKAGTNLSNGPNISGALTDTLLVSNVAAKDVGVYTLAVTNTAGLGAVTSAPPATLTLVQPSGTPYESAVVAANPVAYWRLNETGNPATNPPAYDYAGGLAGIYESNALNGFNAIAGPQPPDWTGFEPNNHALQSTTNTDQSWVTVPALNLNTNTVTFTLWLNPNGTQDPLTPGLFYTRQGSTSAAGIGYQTADQLGYNWNNDPATYNFQSGLYVPANQWSLAALVIEPTQATLYLYNTNGLSSVINSVTNANVAWDGTGRIGNDENNVNRTFNGIMDEVAVFNYAFTPDQVLNLYNAASSVLLNIQKVGGSVVLNWPKGTLLESTNVTGPWTTNIASSPYTNPPTGSKKFYRVQVP
jgi:hypothetical protein